MKDKFKGSKIILGGSSILGVIVFLAIIIGFQYISVKNPVRWDLTQEKQHTLSSQSIQVTQGFRDQNTPVEILAFYEAKDQRSIIAATDLFDRYRDIWNGIRYSFYDPDRERAIAMQNRVDSYPTVLVRSGDKTERLTNVDEESLTNAMIRLQRNEVKKVYFLKGHGELSIKSTDNLGLSIAREHVEKQNYRTEELILMQSLEVPTDASLLIMAGPRTDPLPEELKAIEKYLHRGGAMLVMLNPFQTKELATELRRYGFELTDDIVVDRMSQALGGDYLMPVITSYAQFPITKNFDVASFFPQARSVRVPEKAPDNTNAMELASTSPMSWTISESQLLSGSAEFEEKFGKKGPIPVMAVSTISQIIDQPAPKVSAEDGSRKSGEDVVGFQGKNENKVKGEDSASAVQEKKTVRARLVVFGSSQFASNKFFKLQGNGDLFMNSVSWLAEDENLISIRPKSLKAQPVVLTAYDSFVALVVPVILTPLSVIMIGVAVFFYRRKSLTV